MFSSFAKGTQTVAKTLVVRRSESIRFAITSISSRINGVQLSSYRFFFEKCDYERTNFAKSHNNQYRSILNQNITSRYLSTFDHSALIDANFPAIINNEKRAFRSVFPDILRELSEIAAQNQPNYTAEWFAKSVEYNATRGKLNRGLITVLAFKILAKPEMITPENIRLAQYLGWCTEMINAFLMIIDDIMDDSEIRRGWPCWYKLDDVKLTAVNDAIMMENGIYMLLKKHFRNTTYYVNILELYHEGVLTACCGQVLDVHNVGVDEFTMDRYSTIALNKAAYYSFYLPISLAMYLTGCTDPAMFHQVKEISIKMGEFFQSQNDIFDCFGNPNLTGQIGNDIENGVTTWLSTRCMQLANEEQKNIMRENYGKNDPEKIASIKKLYEELDLLNAFSNYQKEIYNFLENEQIPSDVPHIFVKLKRLMFNIFIYGCEVFDKIKIDKKV